jgi:hypothetical protein
MVAWASRPRCQAGGARPVGRLLRGWSWDLETWRPGELKSRVLGLESRGGEAWGLGAWRLAGDGELVRLREAAIVRG